FCIECGTPLNGAGAPAKAAPPSAPSAPPQAPAQPGGQGARLFGGQISAETGGWGPGSSSLPEERRKATVLFADLSGYTAVAERLQSAARPGSVTVGRTTHRLTRGPVEYEELEPLTLKGKSEPVPAWEAVRLLVSGTAARGTRTAAPLIGREDESSLLVSLFDRVVREGRPHLVTVIGQAGVGKTRLLREFATQLADREQQAA